MCTEQFVRGSLKQKWGERSLPNTKYALERATSVGPSTVTRGTTTFAQHLHQRNAPPPADKTYCYILSPEEKGIKI